MLIPLLAINQQEMNAVIRYLASRVDIGGIAFVSVFVVFWGLIWASNHQKKP